MSGSRGSIRVRTLWAMLAVGGLAAVLVGAASMAALTRELHYQAGTTTALVCRMVKTHVNEEIGAGRQLVERAAARLAETRFDEDSLDRVLGDALAFHPVFDSIYAYDLAEQVVIRRYPTGKDTSPGRSRTLDEKGDPPFSEAARKTLVDGETRALPVRISSKGTSYVPLITGVRGPDRKVVGLLSGAISAAGQGFQEMIAALALGHRGYVMLTDAEGVVLASSEGAPAKVGERFSPERTRHWGELQLVHPGGIDFASVQELDGIGIRVVCGLPREKALEALPEVLTRAAVMALLALVLAGALGVWLSERIAGPIQRLVEGIRRLGEGVLTHRVPVEGEDELADAASAFNRLAETLARNRMIEEFWNDPDLDDSGSADRDALAPDPDPPA